ncbi:MAG: ABC transporter ATP-binding protein [Theionarchaea archaeon]|nr:ABC transporter ATP-binding protein [Theionarchaea archaeon]
MPEDYEAQSADVRKRIEGRLEPGEEIILVTDTDISREGTFGNRFLIVTSKRIMVFTPGGDDPEIEIPLEKVKKVEVTHLVGQVALEAEVGKGKVEILRSSNSLSTKFSKVAKSLTDASKDKKTPEFDLEDEEARVCAECGRLLPEKGSFCPACLKKRKVIARFWKYVRPHWVKFVAISAIILVGMVVSLIPPLLVRTLVDDVLLANGSKQQLLMLVGALMGVYITQSLLGILRGRMAAWLSSRIVHELRFELYNAIQGLNLKRIDKTQTGALMSRLTRDTQRLNWVFADLGMMIVPALLQLVGICVMLIILNWRLAILVLLPAPGIVLATIWFYRKLHTLYHRVWQRESKMMAQAQDSISGIRVVKAFTQEPQEVKRFGEKSHETYVITAIADSTWATSYPLISFITMTSTFLVWYFGGSRVIDGPLTIGTLMAFFTYLGMFYSPLEMLTRMTDYVNRAFTAAQRLFEITDADQEIYEDPNAKSLDELKGEFKFDNVHFGYVKDKPVIKGMDVEVKPGEMIGLVGRSGVGKTTMINLVCRFYDVDEGAILLDGVDIRKIKLRDLRRNIGIVPQESFLFNGTIAENIAYAKPGATREEIIKSAIAANAHGFIMRFPDGYDTLVGERGSRVSGGEKQRIAIARAILHDPQILILDEATSLVDTQTESLIQEALTNLVKGRTTFAIAHRLSTLKNADRLLVIDDGKKAEFGTHDELIEKKGVYYKLVEMQTRLSAIKAVDG